MNFKRSTTSMTIALMALSLVSMTSVQQDAFAQTLGMSITATAAEGSDTITITGKTTSDITDITLTVISEDRKVVDVHQMTPDDDGEFAKQIKVGPNWKDGLYKIKAMQGSSLYTLKVFAEVVNGMTVETSSTESNLDDGSFTGIIDNVATDAGIILDEIVIENGSTMFEVTGMTDRVSEDITVTVTAPNGNVVTVSQISPEVNGSFAKAITVGGPLWRQDGFYTVVLQQSDNSKYTTSTEIDIKDGVVVPEFGTIAAMILAVAIISIIAISAKSRLSIIPRY